MTALQFGEQLTHAVTVRLPDLRQKPKPVLTNPCYSLDALMYVKKQTDS